VGLADQVLDDIIQQKSDILEEKYDEIVDKLSPMESKKFNNFINRKDDEKVNLKLRRELRVQLYNNRHFAKSAKKMLEINAKSIKNIPIDNADNDIDDDKLSNILKTLTDTEIEELKSRLNK
jgi:hypothetical protein